MTKKLKFGLIGCGRIAKYNHEFEGYNSRLDGLRAAILNIKLKYIVDWTKKRRKVAEKYSELLSNIQGLVLPLVGKQFNPVWHLYVIRAIKRDELMTYLKEKGISTGAHYPIALPNLKAYKDFKYKTTDFPIASLYQNQLLSLPIYPEISTEEIEYISKAIKTFYGIKSIIN